MFAMRPATPDDQDGIARVVRARSTWLEERDMPSWREAAGSIAGQAADPHFPVWVLVEDGGRVVGCTSLFEQTPPLGWTEEERAESAYFLATSCTDPTYQWARPGTLMAWWSVDKAAREGRTWVRRGCVYERLVRHNLAQGFHVVRALEREGMELRLMARRAEPMPQLADMFEGTATAPGQ
ncbi:GNAT family N-acetyltransferase [Streptomyces sp. NPDC002454]|uniref:GNAT family N-acetyltransferase n=1 Tax=Streptomyces sp. NPDC002490 TaxID=3154416 RepID=UPI00332AD6FB